MLSQTVQWLASSMFNCQMVGLCFVQLSNGRTVLGWLVAVFSITGKPLWTLGLGLLEVFFPFFPTVPTLSLYSATHLVDQSTLRDSALLSPILTLLAYPKVDI